MSRLQAFFCVLGLALASPALASPGECPTAEQTSQMSAFRDRIAHADTPAAARRLALNETRLGHKAVKRAGRMFPGNSEIQAADAKLSGFEAGVRSADSQEAVAAQFDGLMAPRPMFGSGGSCDYTGVEILIIVLGFIFGIIPGIIFLFLFC